MQKRIKKVLICIFIIIFSLNFDMTSFAQENTSNSIVISSNYIKTETTVEEPESYPANIFGVFIVFFMGFLILKAYRKSRKDQ